MLRPIVICMFGDASPSIWIHTHEALTLGKSEWQRRIVSLDRVVRESFATLTVTETRQITSDTYPVAGVILPDDTTASLDRAGHFLALYSQEGPDAVAVAVFV